MTSHVEEQPPAPTRGRRFAGSSAWLALLVLVVAGFGFVASRSETPPETGPPTGDAAAARQAIDALLAPDRSPDALALLPTDFTEVTGVIPATAAAPDGTVRAIHPGGGCSTPWGIDNTRWGFGTACKAHDLGYDLLRYADHKGQPLAPAVRVALDERLSADMHARCTTAPAGQQGRCHATASVYSAGLIVNSWHQRWGPPVGEPIVPMLAGVAVIGLLLAFRLRGWLRTHRTHHGLRARLPRRTRQPRTPQPRSPAAPVPGGRWTLLGVGSIVLLMLGESSVALAGWAGASEAWLWPFTWLAQLAFVFFFAAGHANAAGWLAVVRSGGGYREYLSHRASWLLRLTLVFAVAAFALPMALELLHIPEGTSTVVVRIALHPLWLLGLYVLLTAAAPALLALHRRSPLLTFAGIAGLLVAGEVLAARLDSVILRDLGALGLALLAQQLAFAHADGLRLRRWLRWTAGLAAAAGLVAGVASGAVPLTLLGTPDTPPALSGPTAGVLLLGVVQLGLLNLARKPLTRLARGQAVRRAAGFASRAPMSLYLTFLAAMLLLVAVVYLEPQLGAELGWMLRPRALLALTLLAAPAAVVFWWFERHLGFRPPPLPTVQQVRPGLERTLARGATAAGLGYATLGVFGLALTSFDGELAQGNVLLSGLVHDPIQSLVHLLLGMSLLHTVRTGVSGAPSTWLLTALACVPPLLSATATTGTPALGVIVHGTTAVLAVAATVLTWLIARPTVRYAL